MRASTRPGALAATAVVLTAIVLTGCGPASPRPETAPTPDSARVARRAAEHRRTDAVSTLDRAAWERTPHARIEEVLMGRVPGLLVQRGADGEFVLRIRGSASFMGNDEPLVVIDGMPIHGQGASRALKGIAPNDVARVEVLKDAGATSIWGMRGANGVIVITTRRQ